MTAKEREDEKLLRKERLSEGKGNADDVDNRLGEPYVTDNKTEREMLTEGCQPEMLPRCKVRTIKLEEMAKGTDRLSIPHINSSGQL